MLELVNTPGSEAPVVLREVGEPDPAPDEAVVEVRAFSLNRGELALMGSRPEGWRPGQDVAGVVARGAADGMRPGEGEGVVALVEGGGWSEHVAVPTDRLAILPEAVGFEAAATLPIAGLTALRILRFGGLLLGKRVLVTGASGGVGRFAVQLAARSGVGVCGVVGSPERGEGLAELGAREVVTHIGDASGPFDLILESVGGGSLSAAIGLVAPHGTVVVFGNSSGEPTPVSLYDFFGHEGARLQTFFSYDPGTLRTHAEDLALLGSLVGSGELAPQIGAEASWREVAGTVEALRDRRVNGKAVFRVE